MRSITSYKLEILVCDPYSQLNSNEIDKSINCINELPIDEKFEVIIGAVNHSYFKDLSENDYMRLANENSIFMDLKGMLPRSLDPIRP